MSDEPLAPPQPSLGDRAFSLVRLGLAAIPGTSAAAELLGFISSPLDRRRDEWMRRVVAELRRIENEQPQRLAELAESELFASVCLQAAQAALRAENAQKRQMLAMAVVTSARGSDIEGDLQLTFVRYLDELTATHVGILSVFADHEADLRQTGGYPQMLQLLRQRSAIQCNEERFMLFCGDLSARLLLRLSPYLENFNDLIETPVITAEGPHEGAPLLARVTDIGRSFLRFVGSGSTAQAI